MTASLFYFRYIFVGSAVFFSRYRQQKWRLIRSCSEQFNADLNFCLITKAALSFIDKKQCSQFSFLKPKQFDCVKRALKGDTLLVLPTGFGKSLIYEL